MISVRNAQVFLNREMEETEGIVLKSVDYKDHERIITVFTRDYGLASLIVKGITPSNLQKLAATTPFTQAEFVFSRGKSDLLRYKESRLLADHHALRRHFSSLETAGSMVRAILQSQLPGKPAPALYALFSSCLKQIPAFPSPLPLASSFLLKLLECEGLLALDDIHLPVLNPDEKNIFKELARSRSYEGLRRLSVTKELGDKIKDYFISCIG
jgi:DNA repair protein RecO